MRVTTCLLRVFTRLPGRLSLTYIKPAYALLYRRLGVRANTSQIGGRLLMPKFAQASGR